MNPTKLNSTELPSASSLIQEAWKMYRAKYQLFIKILLIPFVVSLPYLFFSTLSESDKLRETFASYALLSSPQLEFAVTITGLVYIITSLFGQLASLHAIVHYNQNLDAQTCYIQSRPKLWPYVWVSILTFLLVIGGIFFFIVPGLVFGVWFLFSHIVLYDRDIRGSQALLVSRELARNQFWGIIWRGLVFLFAFLLISIIAQLVIVGAIFILRLVLPLPVGVIELLNNFGNMVLMYAITPLAGLALFLLYKNLSKTAGELKIPLKRKILPYSITATLGGLLAIGCLVVFTIFITHFFPHGIQTKNLELITTQIPIKIYQEKNGLYPKSLNDLVPDYISQVPDLGFDRQLIYTPKEDYHSYRLCVVSKEKEEECVNSY